MSASKVLDQAERQGLLDAKVIDELRKQIAESKFVVTPEAVAKILVDKGQLTAFQARRLVASAMEEPAAAVPAAPPPAAEKPAAKKPVQESDLYLADLTSPADVPFPPATAPLPPVSAPPKPPAAKPPAARPPAPRNVVEGPPTAPPVAAPPKPKRPSSKNRPSPGPTVDMGSPAQLGALLTPLGETETLSPPASQAWKGSPLSPLGAAEGLMPLDPLTERRPAAVPSKKVKKSHGYSLIFILTTALGVILLPFVFLAFWFLFGNSADIFHKAEDEYDKGALASALEKYDRFLESNPTGPEASRARVRRNMAEIRQVSSEGKNGRAGLPALQRLLPEMEQEEAFSDIRVELRTVLVEVASSFASQAVGMKDTAKREELVALAEKTMKLVDNPAYIPAKEKAEILPQLTEVADRLKAARRSIDQDKELVKALAAIQKAVGAADAVAAYKVRLDLIRAFPAVEADSGLAEATQAIGQMEQKQVKAERSSLAASTADPAPVHSSIILATRAGDSSLEGSAVVLVTGSLFGLNEKDGKVNWRRPVGFETLTHPVQLLREKNSDVIAVDSRKHELLRLESATGKLVWKLAVGQPFMAPVIGDPSPANGDEKIYVTTKDGKILEIDAKTGNSEQQAKLPQKPGVAPAVDAPRGKLYQPGLHSTLFVLRADDLQCTQTVYLGHKPGAIAVPPVAVLDHLLVVENPADDYAVVHMFAPQEAGKGLAELPEPLRLKGRVVVPMAVEGKRVVIVTDLGQVTVLQVDPSNKSRPIRRIGGSEAIEKTPGLSYYAVDKGMIFVGGNQLAGYEIQGSQEKLGRKWTVAADDAFVAPLQIAESAVIHIRRQKGSLATTVEAANPATGAPLWSVDLAAPLAALFPSEARKQIVAVTSRGRVFELPAEANAAGYSDAPAFVPLAGTEAMTLTDGIRVGKDKWACLGMQFSGHYLTYDNAAASNRTKHFEARVPGNDASAPAVAFRGGAAVPFSSGQVKLLSVDSAGDLALPFQPPLQAGQRLNWKQAAVLSADGSVLAISDGSVLAVSDGANTIFRLTVKNEPQPHLESLGEIVVENDVVAPLAVAGGTLYAVGHSPTIDVLYSFEAPDLQPGPKTPLQGRVRFGPVQAGDVVFVADDKSLHCCEGAGKIRWSIPLSHGIPSAPPIPHEQDFVIVTQTGSVYRVSQDKGQEAGLVEIGEPLTAPASLFNGRLLAAGPDGTIHLVPLPKGP
ncbi:MAG: PQQ-binding-like beta-propeller repeat protein [Pirellulaceae bacterium]